jgi:hypothetical protein
MKKLLNFFKKTSSPEVKIWSMMPGLEAIEPPVPMKECIPDWFKNMPKDVPGAEMLHPGTAKRCPSFIDFFNQGYVIKLWCDLYVDIDDSGNFKIKVPENSYLFETHPNDQFLNYIPDKKTYSLIIKGVCPWRIETPPGYSVLQLPIFYDFNKDFTVLPGTIWTDIHHEINQQIAFYKPGEYLIKRGTPLAVYIPFKREKITYTISMLTEEIMLKSQRAYHWWSGKFKNGYREHQNLIKKENSK